MKRPVKRKDRGANVIRFSILPTIILVTFLIGCAGVSERHLLTVPVVSMTHSRLPENYRLQSGASFFSEFCEDDEPVQQTGAVIGMADQAILKAQKRYKATHLLDVRIVRERDCVIAEGTTAKAVRVQARTSKIKKSASYSMSSGGRSPASGSVRSELSKWELSDDLEFTTDVLPADDDAPPGIL